MLNRAPSRPYYPLAMSPRFSFGLGSLLLHYIRTLMNRVRWEENRELRSLQTRGSTLPRNTEQANKLYIATEQSLSLSEEARLQRIDQILGTRTHFQPVKPYQERLDSDHIMDLQELKKQHPQASRTTLDWLNPQADVKIRYKNKRKYYSFLSKLRTYPHHQAASYDFADETNQNTIAFLGRETVYSTISLKPVELTAQSLQGQPAGTAEKGWFQNENYIYFRPEGTMTLVRVAKALFRREQGETGLLQALAEGKAEEVVSLEELYLALKEHDTDERVSEYLKKVQNGRIEYLFSELSFDRQENTLAVMIDLLGTKKEYCLILKNLTMPQLKPRPIFNVRPQALFTADGKNICYVQRSPEGMWTELAFKRVESCWAGENEVTKEEQEGEGEVLFRCDAGKEMRLGTDSNKNYLFLAMRYAHQDYSESLFLIDKKEEGLQLIQLDRGEKCKYYFDACPQGLLIARFHPADSFLKYGSNLQYATSVQLIPPKQHLQLHSTQKMGIHDGLLPLSSGKEQAIPPSQFDPSAKRTIFRAGEQEFIRELQTRASHLIAVLNLYSVYDRAVLSFLPFKPTAHPHSLLLAGGSSLALRTDTHNYNSQEVQFTRPYGCLSVQKTYSIWKKQLSDADQERSRFHYQTYTIEGEYPIQLAITTRSLYAEDGSLPVIIYFPSRNEELDGAAARQLLEKGVRVVEFRGRGTFSRDLEHFLRGSRGNFAGMMDDLQTVVEFIGNNLTKNISIYCKGQISSLVGLWFNIYFPFLFNASVLHNGLYDLADPIYTAAAKDFLGETKDGQWDKFNIFKHSFKQPSIIQPNPRAIGTLQNFIISSDKQHRVESRKLIHRLRENQVFRYEEVYLKEYDNEAETDLFNLSYLYNKIRTRMEDQRNDPDFNQPEEIPSPAKDEQK